MLTPLERRPSAQAMGADELTAELARRVAGPSKAIVLTFVNLVRLDFAQTWVSHVTRLNMTNWLVGATDDRALTGLKAVGIPCFSIRTSLPGGEWDWGSPTFKALGSHKVALIHTALTWGLALIITDIDALVLREPFAFMRRWPNVGFLTTTDHLSNSSGSDDGGLEDHSSLNSVTRPGP